MLGMAAALAAEMEDFPGGPAGPGRQRRPPGAEAMRLLRWPAERLDTLGGYLTYHNVMLFNLFLAIYGVVQGARDIRGAEERGGARGGAGHRAPEGGGGARPGDRVRHRGGPDRPGDRAGPGRRASLLGTSPTSAAR